MDIWAEAFTHCRHTKKLKNFITNEIDIQTYKNATFETIFTSLLDLCLKTEGLGLLVVYDLTAAICRFYKINIDRVYIIGNGPKNAVKLLGLKPKKQCIRDITISYVEINEIIEAFHKYSYTIDAKILHSKNGDDFESYICKWQKYIDEMYLYKRTV